MAANAKAIKAGGAYWEIGAHLGPLKAALSEGLKRLKAFGAAAKSILGSAVQGAAFGLGMNSITAAYDTLKSITVDWMEMASTAGSASKLLGFTDEDVESAKQMRTAWYELGKAWFHLKNAIGAALAPALTAIARALVPIFENIAKWIQQNKALVPTIIGIGASLVALPIALVVGGFKMLVSLFEMLSETQVGSVFKSMGEVMEGIGNAIIGGNFQLAFDIFWTAFELGGMKAIKVVGEAIQAMLDAITDGLNEVFEKLTTIKLPFGQKLELFKLPKLELPKLGWDAGIAAREGKLEGLLGRAKEKSQSKGEGATMRFWERAGSVGANIVNSSGAASSIAKAYNDPANSIWEQILKQEEKGNTFLSQIAKQTALMIQFNQVK